MFNITLDDLISHDCPIQLLSFESLILDELVVEQSFITQVHNRSD
jgi:hypothetical protein